MTLRIATRTSDLAMWQARTAQERLRAVHPGLEVELVPVSSAGDKDRTTELARFGRIGIFTVEVDRAVVEGRADAAVHSLKDLTTTLFDGVRLGAVLERGPVEDAWISPTGLGIEELPEGARVASGSLRRRAMLLALRPDLELVDIRGNVETRLAKVAGGDAVATILARAGLERLGLAQHVHSVLGTDLFLPAVAQGLVGVTCRADDDETYERLVAIRDPDGFDAGRAERGFLAGLRGGCNVPAGALAEVAGDSVTVRGRVLAPDGSAEVEGSRSGARADGERLGRELAEELLANGAAAWVDALRS